MPQGKSSFMGLALLLLVASTACAQPYHELTAAPEASLLELYDRSIYDSAVYREQHLRPLRPLVPDANGEVLMATVTARDGKPGDVMIVSGAGIWVTGVPEVQDKCRTFRGDVVMQVRQLLGLPPDAHVPHVLTLRVQAKDVFRPALDASIHTTLPCTQLHDAPTPPNCGNAFAAGTSPEHYTWIAQQSFALHALPRGYPWTHLGYTYNWKPGEDRYGASEYVIRPGAVAFIVDNVTPEDYCRPTAE